MSDAIRKLIRELIEEEIELEETTSSGAAGPYNTPFAFRGNTADGKAKAKKNATQAGMTLVDKSQEKADEAGPQDNDAVSFGEKGAGALKKPKDEPKPKIEESRYAEYKMQEGSPSQKIGKAIREINRQISEVDRVLRMNERLKTETGMNGGQLWKSTARGLTKLESRMNTLSARIRNLKA
jgi:hypothetical protein